MTADERIERLLNRFGQTISDLPKPESKKHYTYRLHKKQNLDKAARKWDGIDECFSWDVVGDYACHLCDVIDRMEIALETALRVLRILSCFPCDKEDDCNRLSCDFRIDDYYLTDDISKKDAERYIDDADS